MIPILLEGIKEQTTTIDSLNIRLSNLESIVASCCAQPKISNEQIEEKIKVELNYESEHILFQNEPNPYSGSTNIRYFIASNFSKAEIAFQDQTGKSLKIVQLKNKGSGNLEVYSNQLPAGIYTYSLLING